MDSLEDLHPQSRQISGMAGERVRVGKCAGQDRQRDLFPGWRRQPDAHAQGAARAGYEAFSANGKMIIRGEQMPGTVSGICFVDWHYGRTAVRDRNAIRAIALAVALLATLGAAQAFDETKFPDW